MSTAPLSTYAECQLQRRLPALGEVWTCGTVIPQGVNAQEASKMTLGSGNSPIDE